MASNQLKGTGLHSLAEGDIRIQSLPASLVTIRTNLKAGAFKCKRITSAEAEACCTQYEHAGSVYLDVDSGYYGCSVDKGTGDWD